MHVVKLIVHAVENTSTVCCSRVPATWTKLCLHSWVT